MSNKKEGYTLSILKSQYGVTKHNIQYLVRLIGKHGFEILSASKNKYYIKYFKEESINRVLINHEPV